MQGETQVQFPGDRRRVPDPSVMCGLYRIVSPRVGWLPPDLDAWLFTSLSPRTSEACHSQLRFSCKWLHSDLRSDVKNRVWRCSEHGSCRICSKTLLTLAPACSRRFRNSLRSCNTLRAPKWLNWCLTWGGSVSVLLVCRDPKGMTSPWFTVTPMSETTFLLSPAKSIWTEISKHFIATNFVPLSRVKNQGTLC